MPVLPYQSPRMPALPYQIPDWCGAPWHRYKLEIMQDNKVVGEFNIHGKGTFLFGKLPTCDFQINDDNISEHHAVLVFKPSGEAFICNLSGNVNKHETKELRLGDLIGFGKSKPKRLCAFQHLMSLVETKKIAEKLDVAELKGKRVLVRVDLDVPLNENFQIMDDTRLQASVPTIKHLQEKEGLAKYLKPSAAGNLLRHEGHYLVDVLSFPKRPFAAVVSGFNLSLKIGVIEYLLDKVDILLLGGGLIFTFLMAEGYSIVSSLVERAMVDAAKKVLEKAKEKQVRTDSIKRFTDVLIIWSMSEFDNFAVGTEAIARKLADLTEKEEVSTIVRGGATVAAVRRLGLRMSHMSAGESDASLEFLKGLPLPGILALDSVD
ncbi:hypothetical protein ACLB2K_054379 [Fragaria x ananassa]